MTRLSLGVQSTVPHVLAGLGRRHGDRQVLEAAAAVAGAGFGHWSMDLIIGGAGETDGDWERSLGDLLGLTCPPPHLSAYSLTVEPGTPLAADPDRHPDEDVQADQVRDGRADPRRGRVPMGGDLQLGATRARVPSQPAVLGTGRLPGHRVGGPFPPGRPAMVEREDPRPVLSPIRVGRAPRRARRCSPTPSDASSSWPSRCAPRRVYRPTACPTTPSWTA